MSRPATTSRSELDLLDGPVAEAWFAKHQPTVVVLVAAKVGGIQSNNKSWRCGVRRYLFLGSSCIDPNFAEQPIREESLLTGALEPTNQWYAISLMPTNLTCWGTGSPLREFLYLENLGSPQAAAFQQAASESWPVAGRKLAAVPQPGLCARRSHRARPSPSGGSIGTGVPFGSPG